MKFNIFFFGFSILILYFVQGEDLLRGITKSNNKEAKIFYFNAINGMIIKYRNIDRKSLNLASQSIFTFDVCSDAKVQIESFDDAFKISHNNPHFSFKLCKKSIGNIDHCQKLHRNDLPEIRPILDYHGRINKYSALDACLTEQRLSELQNLFSILDQRVVTMSHFLKKYTNKSKNKDLLCSEFPLKELSFVKAIGQSLSGTRSSKVTREIPTRILPKKKINETQISTGKKTPKTKIVNKGIINYFIFDAKKDVSPNKKFIKNVVEEILKREMDLQKIKRKQVKKKKQLKTSKKNQTETNNFNK